MPASHSKRRLLAAALVSLTTLLAAPFAAAGVSLELAEGDVVAGELVAIKDGSITVTVEGASRTIALQDISRIALSNDGADVADASLAEPWTMGVTALPAMPQSIARNVRLQAGFHRIVLVTANNGPVPRIDLRINGGGVALRAIPADWLMHAPEDADLAPPKQDATGMRLATAVENARPMITYRIYELPERQWRDAREALGTPPSSTGFAEMIDSGVGEFEAENLAGIAFEGLLNVPQDDTYTFSLQTTGAAQLMIDTVSKIAVGDRWTIQMRDGSRIAGAVGDWTERAVSIALTAESTLSVPVSEIDMMWPSPTDGIPLPSELHIASRVAGEDAAIVQNDDRTATVRGVVKGTDGGQLRFSFGGEERRIALGRLKGIRFAENPKPLPARTHQITLTNGDKLQCTVTATRDGQLTATLPWGDAFTAPLSKVTAIAVLNGRRVYLSDLEPTKVEELPYFSRVMHYRRDVSLSGQPLRLTADGPTLSRGLAVHSYSALTYDLAGGYTAFQTIVGFQQPQGAMGRAALRVEGDGKVLWSKDDALGSEPPIELKLNIKGVKQLTLIADFGQEQDVGDRVVWGEARVIREKAR